MSGTTIWAIDPPEAKSHLNRHRRKMRRVVMPEATDGAQQTQRHRLVRSLPADADADAGGGVGAGVDLVSGAPRRRRADGPRPSALHTVCPLAVDVDKSFYDEWAEAGCVGDGCVAMVAARAISLVCVKRRDDCVARPWSSPGASLGGGE